MYDSPAVAPFAAFPMHEMTKLEWMLNNPEWVNALASGLFAIITIGIILAQVIFSTRAQGRQNKLLQYQLEYARMQSLNVVREDIRARVMKLRTYLSLVKQGGSTVSWDDLRDSVYDLYDQVLRLDSSVYSGHFDGWYGLLIRYIEDMFKAVASDSEAGGGTGKCPTDATLKAFDAAESSWTPLQIAPEIGTAIRMTGNVFHAKWSKLLPFD